MSIRRVWIPSPNFSSRNGASVRLIVLHTTEGARTIEDLGAFFANQANSVSSHTGADDKSDVIGEYVKRENASWTCAAFNPVAIQMELCAFAAWTTDEWFTHESMLQNCATWIREEAQRFGLPITKLTPAQAQGNGRGVCQHSDLGSLGGGHHDCGPGFPIDYVISLARNEITVTGEDEVESMQLQFWKPAGDAVPRAAIVIPSKYRDGKSRLSFGAAGGVQIRVDFGSNGVKSISLDNTQARSADIPSGQQLAVVRLDGGQEIVDYCFNN